jgi:EAL domain-containing protein (putative c-di-GMP-specific phosphodiesterase class I)
VFVNVSLRELSEPDLASFVSAILAEHELTASDIALELTERVVIDEHNQAALETLAELTRLGVRLVIDDFGTGYSALSSLRRFPLAAMKIDGYFVGEIEGPDAPAPIIRALVGLGRALGMMVIAEGVETQVQYDYLCRLGCDAAQGFEFGRPQAATAVSALLGGESELGEPRSLAAPLDTDGTLGDSPVRESTGVAAPPDLR